MINWALNLEIFAFHRLKSQGFVRASLLLLLFLRFFLWSSPHSAANLLQELVNVLYANGDLQEYLSGVKSADWILIGAQALFQFILPIFCILYALILVMETLNGPEGKLQNMAGRGTKDFFMSLFTARLQLKAARLVQTQAKKGQTDAWPKLEEEEQGSFLTSAPEEPEQANSEGQENILRAESLLPRPGETIFICCARRIFKALPKLFLFILLFNLVRAVSVLFFGLPFLFYFSAFLLAPIYMSEGTDFLAAMKQSYRDTSGLKLYILSKYFLITIVISILDSLFYAVFKNYLYSYILLTSLLQAVHVLVEGRYIGLMHLLLGKFPKVGVKATSKL